VSDRLSVIAQPEKKLKRGEPEPADGGTPRLTQNSGVLKKAPQGQRTAPEGPVCYLELVGGRSLPAELSSQEIRHLHHLWWLPQPLRQPSSEHPSSVPSWLLPCWAFSQVLRVPADEPLGQWSEPCALRVQ